LDPGDMSPDWKRGWIAGRTAHGEAMRNEERRLKQGLVYCPYCGRRIDPVDPNTVSDRGAWFCCAKHALLSETKEAS
jgi:hypothetical protein